MCVCVCVCVCACVCMYICMCMCVCVHVSVCVCMCVCVTCPFCLLLLLCSNNKFLSSGCTGYLYFQQKYMSNKIKVHLSLEICIIFTLMSIHSHDKIVILMGQLMYLRAYFHQIQSHGLVVGPYFCNDNKKVLTLKLKYTCTHLGKQLSQDYNLTTTCD